MYVKVNSIQKGGFLEQKKDDDRVIIVYHWNSCGHCRSFMPILHNLLAEKKQLEQMSNIFEIEYDDFQFIPRDLTNVSAFPLVISIEKGNKVDEFNEQRTPENLQDFIQRNKSLESPKSTSSYNSSSSSSSLPLSPSSSSSSSSKKRVLRSYSKSNSKSK